MASVITDINSYAVYSKIYPYRLNFVTWTFIGGIGVMACFLWLTERNTIWELYVGFTLIGAVIVANIYTEIRKRVSYRNYRTFRDDAGFKVVGWENLLRHPDQLKAQYWASNSSVEVILKRDTDEATRKIVGDALYLFTLDANKRYYRARYGSGRVNWKTDSWIKATGSIDVAVAGDIYTLIREYLYTIQRSKGCIEQVNVNFDERVVYVKFQRGAN